MKTLSGALLLLAAEQAYAHANLVQFPNQDSAARVLYPASVVFLVLGVLCTAAAHSLFIAGMRTITARTASMIACLELVYGPIFAAVLLGEVPSGRIVLGGLVVVGVAFYATFKAGAGTEAQQKKGG